MAAGVLEEAHIPRWRRQSVREARAASERAPAAPAVKMRFHTDPEPGAERFQVRYALVTMTDTMDELTGTRVGELQSGDEVEVIDRHGTWVMVRTPYGIEGWIHRTTLGSRVVPKETAETGAPMNVAGAAPATGSSDPSPQLEDILATITAQRQAQSLTKDSKKPIAAQAAVDSAGEASTAPSEASTAPPERDRARPAPDVPEPRQPSTPPDTRRPRPSRQSRPASAS